MADDLSRERTVIAATYSSRRDAEMAQELLEDEGIRAFITADDAGGMHPQLQQTQGVKLTVLEGQAEAARRVLDDTEEAPPSGSSERSAASPGDEAPPDGSTFESKGSFYTVAFIAAALVLLLLLLVLL